MKPGNNPIERYNAEKDGLDILQDIEDFAAEHRGWGTIASGDQERLKWIGTFFRKPTPCRSMMRVQVTNGQVTSGQLRTLAEIASNRGNGVLDLITRQQTPPKGIRINDVPQIVHALQGIDLSSFQTGMDNIRGVNCSPLAGLTSGELFDASPVGVEYTDLLLRNKEFTNLPRKFNVTLNGGLDNCTHTETQDIGMTPAVRASEGAYGFDVKVGGKMGSGGMTLGHDLDVFVDPEEAARLAAEITLLFRDEGPRAKLTRVRMAFLVEDLGIEKFRAVLEDRWGKPLERAQRSVRNEAVEDHLGVNPQNCACISSVVLCAPTGCASSDDRSVLARLADAYGSGDLRLTTDQNAILINVPQDRLPGLLDEPLLQKFSPEPHPFFRGLVTCTGTAAATSPSSRPRLCARA